MEKLVERARQRGRLVETHASWVLLGDQLVYKLKKPVNLGFLDFSTLAKRKVACDAELELNSRLAAGVYQGVVPVRRGRDGAFIDDTEGEWSRKSQSPAEVIIDWAVRMRRLSDTNRADILLARGELNNERVEQLARLLVRFHGECKTNEHIRSFGTPDSILGNVRENFGQTGGMISRYLEPAAEKEIEERQLGFIEHHRDVLGARVDGGYVRDGHGDLRLEHVYFEDDRISVIDCIEFSERFRYADVAADLAFLVMDLRHQGGAQLAELLVSQYAMASGDFGLYRTLNFYEAYRAYVRGKVTALLDQQKNEPSLAEAARLYFHHALAAQTFPPEVPRLIAVGGMIASGKSTLSQRLAPRLRCPVIDTDGCRKRIAGLAPHAQSQDAAFTGLYSAEATERVYATVIRQASWVLSAGRSVIVEGSFRSKAQRAQLTRLARDVGVNLTFVWCHVPRDVALQRLAERVLAPSVSDGRAEIYDDLARNGEPPDGSEFPNFLALDTTRVEADQDTQLAHLGLSMSGRTSG